MNKIRVMFLCAGNACRSQMAEGWTRFLADDLIDVRSAGIDAHGQNQLAISVMAEVGVDISEQYSIRVNGEMLEWADVLVTLCDYADEQCPVLEPQTARLHLPLTDPAKFRGEKDDIVSEFRVCRDKIRKRVDYVLEQLNAWQAANAI